MLNPASGGASPGSGVRNPSAVKIMLTEVIIIRCVHLRFVFTTVRRYSRSTDSYAFYSLKIAIVGGDIRY